ncbi:hypothetical protein Tco_0761328 [Tanacetum coccineum]
MNPQETQQVVVRDEKWVPFSERVKISSTNIRLETIVPQKEETFQVVIDLIKNSTCFKAFTISTDVPEIFMQQFWYSIKKLQGTNSYEFLLSNKKCTVNAEVFRTILNICLRVEGVDFTDVPDDDTALTFFIKLGYKGLLENVDYPKLIWEDLAYQIDHRKEKRSRCENMPYPRFTKIIINHFLKQHTSLSNLKYQHYHSIKDDGIVCRLKFVRIGEDYEEYGLPIPDKTSDTLVADVDVSEESEPELKPAKKRTTSKKRFKKTVTIFAEDNIITEDPNIALELGKSISLTEAKEEEAARKVHATHARIVTQTIPEPTRRKPSESRKSSRSQPGIGGSNEGTGSIPGVPNASTVISATSSEGTGGDEQDSEYSDNSNNDDDVDKDDDANDEGDDYFIEMTNVEVENPKKGDEEVTDATKADAKKTLEVNDDAKKTELPPTSSSLLVSSGFGDQFLKISSDSSLISTVKDTTNVEISSLMDFNIQSKVPHIQSPSVLRVQVSVNSETSVFILVQETPSAVPITTLPPLFVSTIPHLRVVELEKDVSELKKLDLFAESLVILKTQVPTVVDNYLGSKVDKTALEEYDLKSDLYQIMHANKSFNRNPANHRLYHVLMEALIKDKNAMDKGVVDIVQDHKRKHDDDDDDDDESPSAGPN